MRFPVEPKKDKDNKNQNKPDGDNRGPNFQIPRWVWLALWLVFLAWSFFRLPGAINDRIVGSPIEVPYSFFIDQVEANNVERVVIQDARTTGNFVNDVTYPPANASTTDQQSQTSDTFITTLPGNNEAAVEVLLANNVETIVEPPSNNNLLLILFNFAPILLLIGFFVWMAQRSQRQMGGIFGFGRSQAREHNAERPQVTFGDVAGQEAAKGELVEVVDFLKEPDKYIALGARIPRGVLLIGPPGTGKTLLARAVAGEANVAFFSIAASEFVEMFVGVGASRVRDLFKKAKDASPAIVFIDEIDAVGRQRGAGLGGGNDEREQTLNQLLSEMDGFDQSATVIVMAATNRPDVLDPALLRPGRFDRQVTVGMPDRNGRKSILEIHTRDKPLSADVNIGDIAAATIGFSGADLANLANEAALTAARKNNKRLSMRDFLDAFDRIVLGTESPPLSNQHEREVVAYHEAGHAIVASMTPDADPVLKVTIMPRGQALGITAQLPAEDRRNYPRSYLVSRMLVLLGGRTAEEIIFNEVTTGAENDLRRVTDLARRMVAQFGMSEAIGPLNYGDNDQQPFLGYSLSQGRNYSDETASKIDAEVRRIIEEAHVKTRELLDEHRDKLEALAQALLDQEVVERDQVLEIVGRAVESITPEELDQAVAPPSPSAADILSGKTIKDAPEHELKANGHGDAETPANTDHESETSDDVEEQPTNDTQSSNPSA